MKRLTFLILSAFLLSHTFAQITHSFHNTPLTEALRTIELSQSDYTIAILSDDLTDLRTSAKVKNLNTPDAVKLVCKDQPVKQGDNYSIQAESRQPQIMAQRKGL